ncbi:D-alanyl-D-alanine carboxypeptidase family protein [Streptomyces monticola]|uniref:D-alanyl-D-alanine carboxypeptidase family protein n=1 Tax=Streptomyces monticola TaxID=2666263 RepID=A0ABW2JKI4_9ACTN
MRSTLGARRTAAVVLTTGAALVATPLAAAPAQAATAPSVSAKGAYLADAKSGKQLFGKAADTKRQMASTTKVMTVAVVLDSAGLNLDRKLTVKQTYRDYVAAKGASTADLRTGDKLTVRQLLYATLLPSGCDAAYALADAFGSGSTVKARAASFISKMNKKAASLGMKNTKFDSFDGISKAGDNYTTPKDLTKLAAHSVKNSTFRTVVKAKETKQKATASNGGTRTYTWYNTNKLLGSYNGAIGIKTGTGTAAGPCLVFAATRGDKTLVGVILNDANRYPDAAKLLDYGFKSNSAKTMRLRSLPSGAQQD